ncbi:hypothetical protein KGY73_08635 [bacterium]|nr:hypothetical protein [bacterium]
MNLRRGFLLLSAFLIGTAFLYAAENEPSFNQQLLKTFNYRNLGPFRSGSWISDFAVPERPQKAHLYTFYVAGRNGGLWKTTNNGTTFEPLFDHQEVFSIGDVTLAPSDPDIVWVGTGEHATARSSYYGDGVYKSVDAGKNWGHMGLKDTHHISRIVIHPQNPDIVYVAAMGHLFSPNTQRGVFKTEDGGKTWEKVLYINENVGVIDLAINRKHPTVLYAAAYEKYRYPWHFEPGGPESGIYKTSDGGKNWKRLTNGLPEGKIGRIGLDIYRKNPDILYTVVENCNLRPPTDEEKKLDRKKGQEPHKRQIGGEVYRSDDAGQSWTKMNSIEDNVGGKAAYSFNQIRVDPNNDQNIYVTTICLAVSRDGGRTWKDINWPPREMFPTAFGDIRTLWIDPENSDRMLMGSDGGVYQTYDGGKTCDYYPNLPMAQYYDIEVDMEEPYNIYGGLQCHDNWKIPTNSWSGVVTLEDGIPLGGGDGMYNVVDRTNNRWVYNTTQFGGHHRVDQETGTRTSIVPHREKGKAPYRFTWTTPLEISPHNSEIIYTGTQFLLRSMHRGDDWQEISPDLTTNDPEKITGKGHIQYCTITTISESPLTPGVIWVGTDDGKVWLTRDGGANWKDLTPHLVEEGAPENVWVSRVFASHHDPATAYVTKTGFRRDDFRPFIYKTTDFGEIWTDISSNLPNKSINVVFEDRKNPDLLFVGNDKGIYVSINSGERWVYMRNNMPTIAVRDLLVHPRENDLVAGTYGRGIYVTHIGPLQELSPKILDKKLHLFSVQPVVQRSTRRWGNYHLYGDRYFSTPNEPNAAALYYYLGKELAEKIQIKVKKPSGETLKILEGPGKPGLHKVLWDMRPEMSSQERRRLRRRGPFGGMVEPGEYIAEIEVNGEVKQEKILIKGRMGWAVGPQPVEMEEGYCEINHEI